MQQNARVSFGFRNAYLFDVSQTEGAKLSVDQTSRLRRNGISNST